MDPFTFPQSQGPMNVTPGGAPPGARLPEMPMGATTGWMNVEREQHAQAMQELQKQASMMALWEQIQKQQEYTLNEGWRNEERRSGTEKAKYSADNHARERNAEISRKQSDADLAAGTLKGNIEGTNAANKGKVSEEQAKNMERFTDDMATFKYNPMTGAADFEAMADRHNIPKDHQIRQRMRQAQSPEAFQMEMKRMREELVMNIATQRSLQAQAAKDDAHMKRTTAEIAGRASVAAGNNNAALEAAKYRTKGQQAIDKLEEQLTALVQKAFELSKTDPEESARLNAEANEVEKRIRRIKAASAPLVPMVDPRTGGITYGSAADRAGDQPGTNSSKGPNAGKSFKVERDGTRTEIRQ